MLNAIRFSFGKSFDAANLTAPTAVCLLRIETQRLGRRAANRFIGQGPVIGGGGSEAAPSTLRLEAVKLDILRAKLRSLDLGDVSD